MRSAVEASLLFIIRVLIFFAWCFGGRATAIETLMLGPSAKAHGGASVSVVRGSEALFYNPASCHIASEDMELQFEVNLQQLSYGYTYPGESRNEFIQSFPAGYWGMTLKLKRLTYGFSFLPLPFFKTRIQELYIKEAGILTPVPLDIVRSPNAAFNYYAALGLSYNLGNGHYLGASVVSSQFGSKLDVNVSEGNYDLLDRNITEQKRRMILGYNYEKPWGKLAVSFQLQHLVRDGVSQYVGQEIIKNKDDKLGPANISIGGTYRLSPFSFISEVAYFQWSSFTEYEGEDADYLDTFDYVLGLKYHFLQKHSLSFARGNFAQKWGDGKQGNANIGQQKVRGFTYPDFDSIDRTVYSLSYETTISGSVLQMYFMTQLAARVVSDTAVATGEHQVSNYAIGTGLSQPF